MVAQKRRAGHLVLAGLAAVAVAVSITPAVTDVFNPPAATVVARPPCIDGVIPGNPYVVNCNLPPRRGYTVGAAPDAGAIIACRNIPGCLSYYVNYPGSVMFPGFNPNP